MDKTDQTIEAYEKTADEYAKKTIHKLNDSNPLLKIFQGFLKGNKILEIGFGEGLDARWFLENGFDYHGVDPTKAFYNRLWAEKFKDKLINNDIRKIDFPNNSFDGIWAMASLLHLDDQDLKLVLEKCHIWLKKMVFYL